MAEVFSQAIMVSRRVTDFAISHVIDLVHESGMYIFQIYIVFVLSFEPQLSIPDSADSKSELPYLEGRSSVSKPSSAPPLLLLDKFEPPAAIQSVSADQSRQSFDRVESLIFFFISDIFPI